MSVAYSDATRHVMTNIVKLPLFKSLTTIPVFAWPTLLLLVIAYSGFALMSYGYFLGLIHWSIMMPLNGLLIFSIFTVLHDATHRRVSGNSVLNDAIGTLAAQLLLPGITTSVYRFLHLEHHRHTGHPSNDPDDLFTSVSGVKMLFVLCSLDLVWVYWYCQRQHTRPLNERIKIGASFTLSFLWLGLWLTSPYALEFIIVWLIPQRIGLFILGYSFAHIQHPPGYEWQREPFKAIVRISTNPVLRFLMLGQSLHCIHHLMPSLPFYRYHKAWDEFLPLLKDQDIQTRPYFDFNLKQEEPFSNLIRVRVSEITLVAINVKLFELRPVVEGSLPRFEPGSHIDVHLQGQGLRQYSLCNHNAETDRYLIAVKHEIDGRGGSSYMHEQLREGSHLTISRPRNHFNLSSRASFYHLVAGGIGLTPILAMAHQLHAQKKDFALHLCSTDHAHLPFSQQLTDLPFFDKIQVHLNRSQADSKEHASKKFKPRTVIGKRQAGHEVYMCGPNGFMDWVKQELYDLAWAPENIVVENFVAKTFDSTQNKPFEIVLDKSGKTLAVSSNESILQVLEANGIKVHSACTQGLCGTCITPVLEGLPEHRDAILSDFEQAANDRLCVCISRSKSDRLILDI